MNDTTKKVLIKFVLPMIIVIILFVYNAPAGIAALIAYIAYQLFSGRAGIFAFLGSINYSKGDVDNAINWFDKAHKTGKAKPRTVTSYAYLLLKSGKLEESEKVLNKLLESKLHTDDEMYAKSNLALVLWKKGRLDGAVAMLEEVIKSFKTSTIYGSLGYLLILKGDLDRALAFNLEAYEYNSSNTVILDNLGQTYYLKGDYDKAEEIYSKLMSSNPTFPEAYYNYGLVLVKKGSTKKALETMQKALHYKLSFLSTVTREEIESAIDEIKIRVETGNETGKC